MVFKYYYKTRSDGVKLYKTLDVIVDGNGNPIKDENEIPIPSGKMIIQMPTNVEYSEAIDVENAPYYYIESDKEIEKSE